MVFIDGLQWKKDEKVSFFLTKKKKHYMIREVQFVASTQTKIQRGTTYSSTFLTLALITYQMGKIDTLMY